MNKETFNSVISTRNLKSGVYFIQLISEDNSIINTKKFVVE
ncbi:MAG: T9SS type A sorting domain-containing protein [Flavobacteriales bacterium]